MELFEDWGFVFLNWMLWESCVDELMSMKWEDTWTIYIYYFGVIGVQYYLTSGRDVTSCCGRIRAVASSTILKGGECTFLSLFWKSKQQSERWYRS